MVEPKTITKFVSEIEQLKNDDENSMRFIIREGIFEGVEYSIEIENKPEKDGDIVNFPCSFNITNPEVFTERAMALFSRIIQQDFNERVNETLKNIPLEQGEE